MRIPARPIVATAIATVLSAGTLIVPAQAADGSGVYASWTSLSGSPVSLLGAFPSASYPSSVVAEGTPSGADIRKGTSSSAELTLSASTPFGAYFGTSFGQDYLLLRGADLETTVAATITFDSAMPANRWGFALGDVDTDVVKIDATRANGSPLLASQLGWQGAFNSVGDSALPSWNQGTSTLAGSGSATNGETGWFIPEVDVKTLTFTYNVVSGSGGAFRVWIAADDVEEASEVNTPPPWLQAYQRATDGATCLTGWNPSWAEWPNAGTGGFTCERRLEYASGTWIDRAGFSG